MIAWAVQSICAPGQICNFLVFLAKLTRHRVQGGVAVSGKLGEQCLVNVPRQTAAASLLQESGDIAPASRRMLQARIYGGFQFLEAGVTAMVSVE